MVACSGPGSAPAAQGLGTTPGTPQESPQPKEMRLARVLPKSRKQVSWRQGFRAEPWDRSVRFPSTKTPLLVLSWGLLLLQSTPKSLAGKGPTQPPGGCGSRPDRCWSGLPPGSDITQGHPPLLQSRPHVQLTPHWLPGTLSPREGLHAWGGGSCWDSVGCGGSGRVSD